MPLAFLPTWAHTGSCSANCQTAHPGHFPLGHSFYLYLNLLWCNLQLFPCVVWLDLMKKSVIMFRPRWSLKSLSLIVWQRRQALTSPRVFAPIPWGWSCLIPLQISGTLIFSQGFNYFWESHIHTGADKCMQHSPVNFKTLLIPANVINKLLRNTEYLDSSACK